MRTGLRLTSAFGCATLTLAGSSAAQAAQGTCPNPAFQREAQRLVQAWLHENDFSGAVLVAVDGKLVLRQAVGLANRELGVANTPLTKFRIGSVTKQFTAAAILQLQEAGKLSLDDPISKYYPEAPAAWSQVTLRHLLTHTSGIPSYTDPGVVPLVEAVQSPTPVRLMALLRDKPLQFQPGSSFYYNNSGYMILGYVIEKVSGEGYVEYLKQHIFQPLQMAATGYDDPAAIIPDRASGYDLGLDDPIWHNSAYVSTSYLLAAGGLYSTVDDMLKWDQALWSGRLLKPASLTAMTTNYGHGYGFGWYVDQQWGQDRIWHGGDINGFITNNAAYPKAHLAVVVLHNEHTLPEKLALDLAGLCLRTDAFPPEVKETPANLRRYAGYYELDEASVLKIEPRDGVLATHNFQQGDTHFYSQGGGKFFAKTFGARIAFQTGADGQPAGLLLSPGNGPLQLSYKRIDPAEGERLLAIPLAERIATAMPRRQAAARAAAEAAAAASAKPAGP